MASLTVQSGDWPEDLRMGVTLVLAAELSSWMLFFPIVLQPRQSAGKQVQLFFHNHNSSPWSSLLGVEEEEEEKEEGVNGESSGLKAWRDCVLEDVVEAVEEWPIFPVRGDVSIEGCRTRRA